MTRFLRILASFFGILLIILILGPFLVPIPPLEGTVPPKELAGPNSQFVEVAGIDVHYLSSGQGEPAFVLLHGFGASLFTWREIIEPLSAIGTVVAFDRPAFGLTERPMPKDWGMHNPYDPDFQADLTIAFMDQLGLERAILVGNSAGGTQALRTYLAHPARVQALVLVDPAVTMAGSPGWLRPLLNSPQLRRLGPLLVRSIVPRGESLLKTAWHDPTKLDPAVIEAYKVPLKAHNWDRALWEFTLASRSPALEPRLIEVRVPTLVITGDDDRIVPTEQSIRLADALPDAALVIIPNCGHVPQEECPQPFLEAVLHFLPSAIP